MSAASPLLELIDLRVEIATRHGILVPVEGVSLRIDEGEILGVVGESGAGKSMLGSAIVGLLDPGIRVAGGEIRLDGERIDGLPAAALRRIRGRRIGSIYQDPLTALDPLYPIGAQIVETIRTHLPVTADEARRRAVALLDEVGIPAPERRFACLPHELSGGMRQRVVIALALCTEPRLIIADEPTTALDVSIQAQIIDLMTRLRRERGTAFLLVSHDMGVIARAADRVAVMYSGRLAEVGPVRRVIDRPAHPYTACLMRTIPRIARRRDRLDQIEGAMPRLDAVPPGCAFHPRCPSAEARCRVDRPEPEVLPDGAGAAACWRAPGPAASVTASPAEAGAAVAARRPTVARHA
ncbi:MAG: ABC transporter ATP-binding protein [Azospirillaceae bacterium]